MAYRRNAVELRRMERLPNGRVRVEGFLPVGILEYPEFPVPDGKGGTRPRRELLPPEEFSTPEAVSSFLGSPLVVGHPDELIGAKRANVSGALTDYAVIGGARRIAAVIYDGDAIGGLNDAHQLSDGYAVVEDHTPGVWEGQSYDLVQRNPRGDHVAIVRNGRGGSEASIRVNAKKGGTMSIKIQANGAYHAVSESFATALARSKRINVKRLVARKNAEDAADGDEGAGGDSGTTTVNVGGTDYQIPTELAMAIVAGLNISFTVGDQSVGGAFTSESVDEETPPDEMPAEGMPFVMNAKRERGNSMSSNSDARLRALEDALKEERTARLNAQSNVERVQLEPDLKRVLGERYNAADLDASLRLACIARWPGLATRINEDTAAQLRARFEVLQQELADGNFAALPADKRENSEDAVHAKRMNDYYKRQSSHLITAPKAK